MKKVFNYSLFFILLSFIFINSVKAECSYQERKKLLEEAKSVEAYFEADVKNKLFNFYLYNLTDDLFVRIENLSSKQSIEVYNYQIVGDYYTFVEDNIDEKVSYRIHIYSNKQECYGNKLTSKTISKGIINKFYSDSVCNGAEEYMYCQPFLKDKINISDEEVINKINEYKKNLEIIEKQQVVESNFFIDFIKKNWKYILIFGIISGLSVGSVLIISRRKGELK